MQTTVTMSPHTALISKLHEQLFFVLKDGVLVSNQQGIIVDCNSAFHHQLYSDKQSLIGTPLQDLDTPEYAALIPERMALLQRQGHATFETAHRRRDGSIMPVEITAHLFQTDGEQLVFGIVRDRTEHRALQQELQDRLEIFQAAINTTALGFWEVESRTMRFLDVNEAYVQLSGYSRTELLQLGIRDLEAKETEQETQQRREQIERQGFARFRSLHRRKDGTLWPVEVVVSYSPIKGGRFFVFIEDIRQRLERERELELANRVYQTMEQAVVVTDADNRIVSINTACRRITGYEIQELRGKNPRVFASGRHDQAFYAEMWRAINEDGYWQGEIYDRRKDGEVFPKWLSIHVLRDAEGRVDQYVSVFSDISERKKSEELIWHQANFDTLTGLANRIYFQNLLEQDIEQCNREESSLAVMFLDLDGFKDVNDSLGHAAGDALLVEVARRLQQRVRKSDRVARLGGDEFTIVATSFDHPEQVASLAEHILEAIQEPILLQGKRTHIGASIGIALYPEDGEEREILTKHADVAMYRAKADGKNTFRFFRSEMNVQANIRLEMIRHLHLAVRAKHFEIYYQPKIRLSDHRLVGMEALLRWPKDDGVMVPPSRFIPCAEETGLIHALGHWVMSEASRQTQQWNQTYGIQLQLAVNLSARQFRQKNLLEQIVNTLRQSGLPNQLLELEITESVLMSDVEGAIQWMKDVRDQGVSIAIDDFGTGFSSLSYLKRFPITTLKIDRSFVMDLYLSPENTAIVRSIISLAGSLGLQVVAEGVERAEQLDFLSNQGCHMAQGYYLGRPMSEEQFERFLLLYLG